MLKGWHEGPDMVSGQRAAGLLGHDGHALDAGQRSLGDLELGVDIGRPQVVLDSRHPPGLLVSGKTLLAPCAVGNTGCDECLGGVPDAEGGSPAGDHGLVGLG